ncbi:MAG: sigma factor-like helix-turn-helix DNA-binding protein [Pseudonocardia sp.]
MERGQGFERFHRAEAPRLRLLVALMVDDQALRDPILTGSWLIVRHRWPELARQPRPDLWLLTMTLRTLRHRGAPLTVATVQQVETSLPCSEPAAVVAGLRALDPPLRLVVVLRHLLGLSLDEVADVADLPVQLIRDHLSRGLRSVEDHLDERATG